MAYTIPADNHVPGDTGHTTIHNNIADILADALYINPLNTAYSGGADPTGVADSTSAIQAAINAATANQAVVFFSPGTYKVSSTITINTNGILLLGPRMWSRPGNVGDSGSVAPAVIKAANGSNLNAVISDTAWTGAAGNPTPFADVNIVGLDIDANATNQTSGAGHGIILMAQNSTYWGVRVRNTLGHGLVFTDTSLAGNTTTGGTPAALDQNGFFFNNVYLPGIHGLYSQSTGGSLGTDGFCENNIIDHGSAGNGFSVLIENSSGWRVHHNLAKSSETDCFRLLQANNVYLHDNFASNYGSASFGGSYTATNASPAVFTVTSSNFCVGQAVELSGGSIPTGFSNGTIYYVASSPAPTANTFALAASPTGAAVNSTSTGNGTATAYYFGYFVQPAGLGPARIVNNESHSKQAGGGGVGNFSDYYVVSKTTSENIQVFFQGNGIRQISATTGIYAPYVFISQSSGTMPVTGVQSPMFYEAGATPTITATQPTVNGVVTFPDFAGSVQSNAINNPATTTSSSLVMAGINISFTPQVTGKVMVIWHGGAKASGASGIGGNLGLRYATSSFTAGAAVSGTTVGKDQPIDLVNVNNPTHIFLGGVISGLTPGTTYFIDLAYAGNGTNACAPVNMYATFQEVS